MRDALKGIEQIQFDNSEVTHTDLLLDGTSQKLLFATNQRSRLILCNPSVTNLVTVRFDGKPVVAGQGLVLAAMLAAANCGMHYWDSGLGGVPRGLITVIGTAGQRLHAISFVTANLLGAPVPVVPYGGYNEGI